MKFDDSLITSLILLIPTIIFIIKYRKSKFSILLIITFHIYLIYLVKYAIYPIILSTSIKSAFNDRTVYQIFWDNLTLIPFTQTSIRDILLNTLMTIPIGFYTLRFFKSKSFKNSLIVGLTVGFILEAIQGILVFVQGFTFRNISINDIIFNTLGVCIGYLAFKYFFECLIDLTKNKENVIYKFSEFMLKK